MDRLVVKVAQVEERVALWWSRFFKDVFPLLVPRPKWAQSRRNVEIGDIVLVLFQVKYSKDKYRLGRIMSIKPDHHQHVRTVEVGVCV